MVVFRVDSGSEIGSGHVMRCLALALELRRRSVDSLFVTRPHAGHISNRIKAEGFEVVLLPDSPNWTESHDGTLTRAVADERRARCVVVDHYGLGAQWEELMRGSGQVVLAIDDLADRRHAADFLLDQGWFAEAGAERYRALLPATCVPLMGPRFALLQPEYPVVRRVLQRRSGGMRRVLVAFGGNDPTQETVKVLRALAQTEFDNVAVDAVVGPSHTAPQPVIEAAEHLPDATVHLAPSSLAGLIARADVSVGAGGSTTWERLCLELPSLVVTIAGNQVPSTQTLAEAGYVRWLGSAPRSVDAYARALSQEMPHLNDLPGLVDGLGARRVAEALFPSQISSGVLRDARPDDASLFFEWRNDPLTRANSFTQREIPWPSHRDWFASKLADRASVVFVGESDGLPIGQVRIDTDQGAGVLSFSVDPAVRGRGWGAWLVDQGVRRMRDRFRQDVVAYVRPSNPASQRIFSRLGWREAERTPERIQYFLSQQQGGSPQ